MAQVSEHLKKCLIYLIEIYRWVLSPFTMNCCRFDPSCSQYAKEAIQYHGCISGSRLIVLRLLRCHPWHPGGCDPVPTNRS